MGSEGSSGEGGFAIGGGSVKSEEALLGRSGPNRFWYGSGWVWR